MAIINGTGANETLRGGSRDDSISGNGGNDTIYGGAGNDTLWGGSGNDMFVFESTVGANGVDVIKDYKYNVDGQFDVIDLSPLVGSLSSRVNIDSYAQLVAEMVDSQYKVVLKVDKDGTGTRYTSQIAAVLDNLTGGELVRLKAGTSFFTLQAPMLSRPVSTPTDANANTNTVEENVSSGTTVGITASAADPDGGTVTYSLVGDANGSAYTAGTFQINSSTGVVSVLGTVDYEQGSTQTVFIKATSDTDGSSRIASFTINVTNVNEAPSLTGTPSTLTAGSEDTTYTISKTQLLSGYSDPEAASMSISNLSANNGTVADNGNDTYTITPSANFNGTMTLSYKISDGTNEVNATRTYSVTAVADTPTIVSQPVFANGTVAITADDPDSSNALKLVVNENNGGTSYIILQTSSGDASIADNTAETVTLAALSTASTGVLAVKSAANGYANTNAWIGVGTTGNDTLDLSSATARSAIFSYGGADSLKGSAYEDVLLLGGGADTAQGGAGKDTYYVSEAAASVDTIIVNAVVGTSSDSAGQSEVGNNNDTGGDTISGFNLGEDIVLIKATNVSAFTHSTNAVIGTATGSKDDGTVGSFLGTVGLIDLNGNGNFLNSGDIAINFASPTGTWNLTNFQAALQYDLTGSSGADAIYGGTLADTISGLGADDMLYGEGGSDSLIGGLGNDFLKGGDGIDALNLSDGGTDTVSLYGVIAVANRDTVSGFTAGANTVSGYDKIEIKKGDTSYSSNTTSIATVASISAAYTFATASNHLLELSFDLAGSGTGNDLDNYTDGTGLLASIGQTLSVGTNSHKGFVLAYQGGNAYLYYVADRGNASDDGTTGSTVLEASEINLVATITGITVGNFTADNFAVTT